ncbi:hypothetical protein K9L05_03815 [Candidatus Babeliales bacterium]|nr:hypothetical protein [Candidatus Babeliales bacterium]MCF7899745.1 hypothetical protein [Candidatus Babeliales bacterium]
MKKSLGLILMILTFQIPMKAMETSTQGYAACSEANQKRIFIKFLRQDFEGANAIIRDERFNINESFQFMVLDRTNYSYAPFYAFRGASFDTYSETGKTIHQLVLDELYVPLRSLLDCHFRNIRENRDCEKLHSSLQFGGSCMMARLFNFLLFFSCEDGSKLSSENFARNIDSLKAKMSDFLATAPRLIEEYKSESNKVGACIDSLKYLLSELEYIKKNGALSTGELAGFWHSGNFFNSLKFVMIMLNSNDGNLLVEDDDIQESFRDLQDFYASKLRQIEEQMTQN